MRVNRVLVAGSVMVFAITATVLPGGSAAARSKRALPQSSPSWARASNLERHATGKVSFALVLPWRHAGELQRFDNAVADPSSSQYGHYLSPSAFRARFAPTSGDVKTTKRWLRTHGFRVTGSSKSGILVNASGTVGKAERAFSTQLNVYRHNGEDLRAPAEQVSLPAGLASTASAVIGLDQTMAHPAAPPPPAFVNAPPCSQNWGEKIAYSKPTAYGQTQPYATCGYKPAQLRGAYGLTRPAVSKDDGSGEKVAILDAFAAPTMNADVPEVQQAPRPSAGEVLAEGLPRLPGRLRHRETSRVGTARRPSTSRPCTRWPPVHTSSTSVPPTPVPGLTTRSPTRSTTGSPRSRPTRTASRARTSRRGLIQLEQQIFKQAISEGIGLYFSSGDNGDE